MDEFESNEGQPRESEVLRARRETLERLRADGHRAVRARFDVGTHAPRTSSRSSSGKLESEEEPGPRVRRWPRDAAPSSRQADVLVIRDRRGDLQLFCEEATLGDGYGLLDLVDLGDIIGATATACGRDGGAVDLRRTAHAAHERRSADRPEEWHGLTIPSAAIAAVPRPGLRSEARDGRARLSNRTKIVRSIREELNGRGFVEVETPTLHPIAGGAAARPFKTHHNGWTSTCSSASPWSYT